MNTTMVVALSANSKLTNGSIGVAATYRPVGDTCPASCKLLGNGCYAQRGCTNFQQMQSKRKHDTFKEVVEKGIGFLRLNVSGDFLYKRRLDKEYLNEIKELARKNPRMKIWGYTHAFKQLISERIGIKIPNLFLFASCDTMDEVRYARKRKWKTARVVDSFKNAVLLPGEAKCLNQVTGITCVQCKICFTEHKNFRGIVFQKH